jgi:hypothetical protein
VLEAEMVRTYEESMLEVKERGRMLLREMRLRP